MNYRLVASSLLILGLFAAQAEDMPFPAGASLKGVIDSTGAAALDGYYYSIVPVGPGRIFAQAMRDGTYAYYENKAKKLEGIEAFQAATYESTVEWPILVKRSGTYSYMNSGGQLIGGVSFDEGTTFFLGRALVKSSGKNFFIDGNCKPLLEVPAYDSVSVPNDPGETWVILSGDRLLAYGEKLEPLCDLSIKDIRSGFKTVDIVETTGKSVVLGLASEKDEIDYQFNYILNYSGKVIKTEYPDVALYHDNIFKFQSNGSWGLIDSDGAILAKADFQIIRKYVNGLSAFMNRGPNKTRMWGFIDARGKIVIPASFRSLQDFSEGLCVYGAVGEDSKWLYGYIDASGKSVIEAKFLEAKDFQDGLALVKDDSGYRYIDRSGKIVAKAQFTTIYSTTGYFNGHALVRDFDESGGKRDWVWYSTDKTGKLVAKLAFADVFELSPFDRFGYMQYAATKYGLVDARGAFVVAPQYDRLDPPSEGLYPAKKAGKIRYIDRYGKEKIVLDTDWGTAFHDGYTTITDENAPLRFSLVDRDGRLYPYRFYGSKMHFSEGIAIVYNAKKEASFIDRNLREVFNARQLFSKFFELDDGTLSAEDLKNLNIDSASIFLGKFYYYPAQCGMFKYSKDFRNPSGDIISLYGYITANGTNVTNLNYMEASDFIGDVAAVILKPQTSYSLIDKQFKVFAASGQWQELMGYGKGFFLFRQKGSKQASLVDSRGRTLCSIDVNPDKTNAAVITDDMLFTIGSDNFFTAYAIPSGSVVYRETRYTFDYPYGVLWDIHFYVMNDYAALYGFDGVDLIYDPKGKVIYSRY